jgi:hypothetical protein
MKDEDEFYEKLCAVCLPTCGWISGAGKPKFESGPVKEAVKRWGSAATKLGTLLRREGVGVHVLSDSDFYEGPTIDGKSTPCHVVSFPIKPSVIYPATNMEGIQKRWRGEAEGKLYVPGWQGIPQLAIIRHSTLDLAEIAAARKWKRIGVPVIESSEGDLKWGEVKAMMREILGLPIITVR